jgi:hypothetical protein
MENMTGTEVAKKYWTVELEYLTRATMVIEGNSEEDVQTYIQENATGVEQLKVLRIELADDDMAAEARAWAELQKEYVNEQKKQLN